MSDICLVAFSNVFCMPARIVNSEGKAIQGILEFVGVLLKIIRKVKPTHIIAVFDEEHENSRCAKMLNAYFKSLVGGTADNIKGAEKIGIKTAAMLLKRFETLENIISNAENIVKAVYKKINSRKYRQNYKKI